MVDGTSTGTRALLTASNTFPSGILLSQFADGGDSLNFPEMEIAGSVVGPNGDLMTWDKAAAINVQVNLMPNSENDIDVGLLFEANRTGKGKLSSRDVLSLVIMYPDGSTKTLFNGKMLKGQPANTSQAAGRFADKKYSFVFESMI